MNANRTILVVDDSDDDFDTVLEAHAVWSKSWAGDDFRLIRTETGEECIDYLRGTPGALPHLILLDLNLPGCGGRDALKMIKDDHRFTGVPVVVLSTSASRADIAFCHGYGANAYHVKPFRHEDFITLLGALFNYWPRAVTTASDPL